VGEELLRLRLALSLGQHTGVYKHEDKVRPRRYGVFLVYVKRRISKRRFGEQREHAQTMTRHSRELVGCAPHTALSITGRTGTTEYFVKPGAPDATSAVALCEREAALFANLPGSHRIEDGAMCICNPVRETLGGSRCVLPPHSRRPSYDWHAPRPRAQYLPDCPLTYANETFCKQTGYGLEAIVGRNCRFLQCAETDRDVVKAMGDCFKSFQKRRRRGVRDLGAKTFRVINAKKDGTRFLNLVHMAPLYDQHDKLVRILGVQYGLGLVASPGLRSIFQGVITPNESIGAKTHAAVLGEWGGWKPVSQVGVGSREQATIHMQQLMAVAINDVCRMVDFDQMACIASCVSGSMVIATAMATVTSTLSKKRPFVCAGGGPHGAPMQGIVMPKRGRSVALAQ
jgi:PAS domain S-box-containing protein